jgi:hypothetical protein
MDATNDRLLKAMDPALSRMYKAGMALQNAFASILSGFGSTACSDWEASPFVVSLLPEPVDYFMGCMLTIDCRTRCLDNILAFEEALSEGDEIEVRWTNSHRFYRAIAKVVRVNGKCVRVTVTKAHPKSEAGAYLIGRTLSFPRLLDNKWSVNNGCFPVSL